MRSTQLNPVARILLINLLLNVIMAIRTMFISLSSAVMGTRLPIMMADDDENYKDKFKYIIIAIVVLVVGAVTVSIVSGVGLYILNVFNNTAVKIPANYNYVSPIAPTLGSIFQILVVVLIIVALIFVIRYLMRSTDMF
jgi:predicted membrane protein